MGHQSELRALEDENKRLRAELEKKEASTLEMPVPSSALRGGDPSVQPGEEVPVSGLQGKVPGGAPRDPQSSEGKAEYEGERIKGVGPPPGLESSRDEGDGHRGPSQAHGGDPALVYPGQAAVGGGPSEKRGSQHETQGKSAGLDGVGGVPLPASSDGTEARGPKGPMDAFGLLAQGIAQLQNAMSASIHHKVAEQEVVKPGISELPRLPELSETSCIDIEDWIHSLQCPMGDLSNGSSSWWKEILQCLDRFYSAYLESTNITKLSLKPEACATAYLKEERWGRVDKRATSMILTSLPDAVRAEILALRLSGTLAVLGRVMVLYRPGSAAERQQILRALEGPTGASTATEAVDSLRRWARWLRRATDVGLQCPDASILLRGLDNITRKPLQDHGEVQFRMIMMRYTLEVDAKPTYKAVVDLHHAMLSEFEQVAFRGRPKQVHHAAPAVRSMTTTSGGTSTTPMTSDQGQGDASPGKGKGAPCKFFLTDQGCKRGGQCKYSHEADRKQKQGRCWTCGSKQHVSKQCPTRDKPKSPSRSATTSRQEPTSPSATVAAMAPESAHPIPPAASATSNPTATSSSSSTT